MSTIFKSFDFSLLEDPNFKEDSVREELISPLIKELGYSASGENKIIRSMSLTHPFVYIGTTQRKINIFPDYLLQVQGQNAWILDAKGPNENIQNGSNVEQAYSYATHKDVRVNLYALCNGRELVVFHISKVEPILNIRLKDLETKWEKINKTLSPLGILKPHIKDYKPDLGLHFFKMGASPDIKVHFVGAWVDMISKVEDNFYSIFSSIIIDEVVFAASFDLDGKQYKDFLSKVPCAVKNKIEQGLKRYPYHIIFQQSDAFEIIIEARLGDKIHRNEDEEYLPLRIVSFGIIIHGD